MKHSKKNIRLGIGVVSLFVLSTSACSVFTPEKLEMSDSEACAKLNELIADHANNFKHFRRGRSSSSRVGNMMQIWSAERVFPLAKNCQVWEWSSGLTNYFCSWNESGELQAKASHDKGVDIVGQCLGKQWQSDFANTKSGGGRTLFYQEGDKTVISIHYFKESRTILESWKTTLYVGDESNLKAALQ
ncbi:MAG: hypothetical protein KAI17_02435 [Thiotrichaceae bacterium]|nr:hypothetical protein [Thiotrichaceae bacterium]